MAPTTAEGVSHRSRFVVSDRILRLSGLTRYLVAFVATGASILMRQSLEPIWTGRLPYITLFPAVMLSAWLGGLGPGILTTFITAAAAAYFWIGPARSGSISDAGEWFGLFAFIGAGLMISVLNEAWRRGVRSLAESEQSLEVTLTSIGDAVITTDDQGRVTRLNNIAETLTGWAEAEAIGRPLQEVFVLINEESGQPVPNPVAQVLRDGVVAGLANHTVLMSRDGRAVPIDDSAAPIRARGGVTAGVVLVFRDVTERRRIELEREVQNRIARELAAIVESSDDAIISKDLQGTIMSWNRGAERMFGYTPAEVVGKSIHVIIPEERRSEEDDVLRQIRSGQKVDHFETVRRRKDGSRLFVSLTISPIHSTSGVVIGASKIARDISGQKEAERERAEVLSREQVVRAEVERASRLKDEFIAVLSHELRTPLNAVLGYSQLLTSGTLPAARVGHAIAAIERNARAQARLVESMLDLSRVMAGKLELNLDDVDLIPVIEASADALRPEAEVKGIVFEWRIPASPIRLAGDAARLQQVFWNLFSNALKFTRGPGRITIAVTPATEDVSVAVSDDGQGIKPELIPHVFDRFRQGMNEGGRAPAGLGLGLALVKEMVQAHGGTVRAESRGEGQGSTFTVTLPLRRAPAQPRLVRVPGSSGPGVLAGDILVVDDERDAREFLALFLVGRGATVRTAGSVSEALDAMAGQPPDVLLADIGMPEEDGYSLIRRRRAYEVENHLPRVPAIAVTAYASASDRDAAIAAGYDMHLAKPVDADALVAAISSVTSA